MKKYHLIIYHIRTGETIASFKFETEKEALEFFADSVYDRSIYAIDVIYFFKSEGVGQRVFTSINAG